MGHQPHGQLGQVPNMINIQGNNIHVSMQQVRRKCQLEQDWEMFESSQKKHEAQIKDKVKQLTNDVNLVKSKLAGIKFKIDRKMIKQGARDERRQSIHKLEIQKNLQFHPKRDRSKSIPTINMNLRLQALKDMKEDLLMRKCKISDEIEDEELELRIPVNEYNYNDIKRQILPKPIIATVQQPQLKKRNPFPNQNEEEKNIDHNVIEEEKHSNSQSENQDGPQHMKLKMIYTYKYRTKYGPIPLEEEEKEEEQKQPAPLAPFPVANNFN